MENIEELLKDMKFIMIVRRSIILSFILLGIVIALSNLLPVSGGLTFWLSFWLFTTIPFEAILKRTKTSKTIENANFFYFLIEVFFITGAIHYIGGISWLSGIFYSITIIFAHFVLPRRKAIYLTIIAVFIFFNGLILLEFVGTLPHYILFDKNAYSNPLYVVVTMLMINFFLMFLAGILGVFASTLKRKKEDVEMMSKKIEEEKSVLEVKINARTKEARNLTESLKEKVDQKTNNLAKKVKEMENFNKLIKGREEKLIELEKEAERLKTKMEV